jgi:hypothetical protein
VSAMPTVEAPQAIERAAHAAHEREQELREAEAALAAAERAVEEGRRQDIEAVAAARDAGDADPPQSHEAEARQALAEAECERDVRAARARIADENLQELLTENAGGWQAKVEREWGKADTGLRRKLSEVEALLGRRVELTATWLWLREVQRDGETERTLRKAGALANQLPDLGALADEIDATSFERYAERVEEAERQKREAEEADQAEFAERLAEAQAALERQG